MLINGLLAGGIALLLVSGCARLTNAPAEYSALHPRDLPSRSLAEIDEQMPQTTRRQSPKYRTSNRQGSSYVEPFAVLEASIAARRNWKTQNIANLENERSLLASSRATKEQVTGSVDNTASPRQ
ncbi:hypothetical protein OCOJLMKI_3479 [Methylobacterium iners]|uniref:Lipoprotein n=1 Tax=Methylobacterium iners TaxID=418707 RepID=A0ABQ4S1A4_9HYPH|nr:hypothetical protein OCOJLMKI_3479 [Methylobacterium iners]